MCVCVCVCEREREREGELYGRPGQLLWGAPASLQLKAALIMRLWFSADPHSLLSPSLPLWLSCTQPASVEFIWRTCCVLRDVNIHV